MDTESVDPDGEVVYLTDITHDLSSMPEDWALQTVIAVKKIAAMDPFARYEMWTRGERRFIRVVRRRTARNIVHLLGKMVEEYGPWQDMPPGTVQFAILDARYEPTDGIPPHLRKVSKR